MRELKYKAVLNEEARSKEVIAVVYFNLIDLIRRTVSFDNVDQWKFYQFTGHKDKNGVDIYEGDTLKDDKIYALVEWDNAGARFYSKKGTNEAWVNCEVVEKRKKGWLNI